MRGTIYVRMVVVSSIAILAFSIASVRAFTAPAANTNIYLPFVAKNGPLPEGLEITASSSWVDDNPENIILSGYVLNRSTQPLKDAQLRMNVKQVSCFEVDPCQTYDRGFVYFSPAFQVSLPGQPNPFYSGPYNQYKISLYFENIRLDDVRRTEPADRTFAPLTLFRVQRDGNGVLGVARNDTEQVLENGRVIVYASSGCGWSEATLDNPTLAPGQESIFRLDRFCRYSDVLAVGQGTVREDKTDTPATTSR